MYSKLDQSFFKSFKKKRAAILQDDSSNERRGILVAPAAGSTPDEVNYLITLTGGLIFVAIGTKRAESFGLDLMSRPQISPTPAKSTSYFSQACISVDAREGITTGISTADRAKTINILGQDSPRTRALVKPGHIFPVRTQPGGVLVKNALPEGAIDLTVIAGFSDAAVYLDLLDQSGQFLNPDGQEALANKEELPLIPLSSLIRYRLESEKIVSQVAEAKLPSRFGGEMKSFIYKSKLHSGEHVVLVKGKIDSDATVLARVQTESTFADVFGGNNPPTRRTLVKSLEAIREADNGVLVYLRKPEAGYLRQQVARPGDNQDSSPPVEMLREYGIGAQILQDLGVKKIELLTNNQKSLIGLKAFGLEIVAQRPV